MSADSIFLLSDDGDDPFVELRAEPYSSENLLQRLLAEHPDLLAGGQMTSGVPRRWLLVSREVGVPRQEGGAGWWSLDHLFLDQDGVPTFVEVKRSSNTEIRRQVVGQMLDYVVKRRLATADGSDPGQGPSLTRDKRKNRELDS